MTKDEALEMIDSALDHSYSEKDVMEIKEALDVPETNFGNIAAQPAQELHNFCPRCGKRTADPTTIHTCTPPQENT
jgi:hypothetical protein